MTPTAAPRSILANRSQLSPPGRLFLALLAVAALGTLGWGQQPAPTPTPTPSAAVDPARGMTRPLNVEEAWVENAAYFVTTVDDHVSPGNQISLAGEGDFAVNSSIGGEVDFPLFVYQHPLGSGPKTFGPMALGLRDVVVAKGTPDSPTAVVLSIEAEGQYWLHPQYADFPGLGNSVTGEALGGYRREATMVQFETGYTQPIGRGAVSGWFGNVAFGRNLSHGLTPQLEFDFNTNSLLEDGRAVLGGAVVPQIGWQWREWFFSVGESLGWAHGQHGLAPATQLLIEHDIG